MHWESYFAELEGQFADDAAQSRRAVASEQERARLAQLDLVNRLGAARADRATLHVTTLGGHQLSGTVGTVGADWSALTDETGSTRCVRIDAIRSLSLSVDARRRSLMPVPETSLSARMTFGYVLRGWARGRTPVMVQFTDSSVATGTFDHAGNDHADLALHDAHLSRRDADVMRVVVVPFTAIAAVVPLSGPAGALI